MPRISKRIVDSVQSAERDVFLWDDELAGFGLKVTPAGRKVYLVQYRIGGRGGKTRRITIGPHGKLTAEQARKFAKEQLGKVAAGIDPAQERDDARKQISLGDAIEKFLTEHVDQKLKPRTAEGYRSELYLHVPPKLLAKKIGEISRQDMAGLHNSLRDRPSLANRLIRVLSKFFNWLDSVGLCDSRDNPCRNIQKYR